MTTLESLARDTGLCVQYRLYYRFQVDCRHGCEHIYKRDFYTLEGLEAFLHGIDTRLAWFAIARM